MGARRSDRLLLRAGTVTPAVGHAGRGSGRGRPHRLCGRLDPMPRAAERIGRKRNPAPCLLSEPRPVHLDPFLPESSQGTKQGLMRGRPALRRRKRGQAGGRLAASGGTDEGRPRSDLQQHGIRHVAQQAGDAGRELNRLAKLPCVVARVDASMSQSPETLDRIGMRGARSGRAAASAARAPAAWVMERVWKA